MAKEYTRAGRIGPLIQRELAQLLQRDFSKPELGLVTISAVRVSKDMDSARVFVTSIGGSTGNRELIEYLRSCAGQMRYRLGKRVVLKRIPQLLFTYDDSIAAGAELSALINSLVPPDSGESGSDGNDAAGAAPAGQSGHTADGNGRSDSNSNKSDT